MLRGCHYASYVYRDNHEYFKAATYYELACEKGYMGSCTTLGTFYEDGLGVQFNPYRSASLYEHACKHKDSMGCFGLGLMYVRKLYCCRTKLSNSS